MTQNNLIRKTFGIDLTQKDMSQEDDNFFTVAGLVAGYNNVDHDGDILVKGIFDESIKKRMSENRPLTVLFNHKSDRPIGIADEFNLDRPDGLGSVAKLIKSSEFVSKEVIPLVKYGAISEFSVGFLTQESDYDKKNNTRIISKARLIEYSLVVKGANDNALIESFKSYLGQVKSIRDIEDLLGEQFGMSASVRKTLISKIKEFSNQREVDKKEERDASSQIIVDKSVEDFATELNNYAIRLALNNINQKIK